ncbi:1-acyl-sn-glycerol-3-phosphate acyltransferase [Trinickia sp. LjRoot230]|uniref:lysophospholipid acyltransferase family protein n=1 Tax=Trinickia sp. LjRoot230 TaxID=3342288 RepID=UPI003ED079B7
MSQARLSSRERAAGGFIPRRLRECRQLVVFYFSLLVLAAACLSWLPCAALVRVTLPRHTARTIGRAFIRHLWRSYFRLLSLLGACRFDLSELETLRDAPPMILAPNHPTLIDAMLIAACVPNLCCVMKAELKRNWFLGPGASLADYLLNDTPHAMINGAVEDLRRGHPLLLFPEGTRTECWPVNPANLLKGGIGLIAARARVPVQTIIIEADLPFLTKGWHILRKPPLPLTYRVRLAKRFDPPDTDPAAIRALIAELHTCYMSELSTEFRPRRP